jgi:hypothetical protein
MPDLKITLSLDTQTARAYSSASPEDKKKIEALLSLWLRSLAAGEYPSFQVVLDKIGQKAEAQGLTPEILESMLDA